MMKRFGSILLTLVMLLTLCMPAAALTTSGAATTLRLEKADGTVTTKNSGGTVIATRDGMRLSNGYEISTEKASYAHISLDSTKAVKMDASSVGAVHQSGDKLELQLSAGSLFFDVTAPLKSNENLTIRTSTMVTGVRGTSGWVTILDTYTSRITLLEGELLVTSTDPVTGLERTTLLRGGQTLTATFEGRGHGFNPDLIGDHVTIQELTEAGVIREEHILYTDVGLTVEELQEEDVPGFVAEEVAKSADLQQRIEETTELIVEEIIGIKDFLEENYPELAEKLQAIITANPDADISEQLAGLVEGDVQELFTQAAEEQVAAEEAAAEEADEAIQEAVENLSAENTDPLFEEEEEEEYYESSGGSSAPAPVPPAVTYTLTTYWQDEQGNDLETSTVQTLNEGVEYTAEEKTFTGYQLKETTGDAVSGTMDGNKAVTFVYAPITYTLTTNWKDEQGNDLETSTVQTLNEGVEYTAEEKTITGYQLKETTGDAVSGTMDSDKTVTFVYEALTEIALDDPTTQELIDALDFGYNIINITNANATQTLDLGAAVAGSAAQAITTNQTVDVQSGTVSTAAGDTVTVDGTLNITGDTAMDNAGTLVGNGTINVSDTAMLTNTGRIEINSTTSLHINAGTVVDNSGTIIIGDTAAGAMTVDGEVNNSGSIIVGNTAGSSMTVAGMLDGTGSVTIAEGSTLEVEDTGYLGSAADGVNDFFEIYGSADFSGWISNGGFLAVQDGGSLTLSGTMDNDALGIDTATISVFGTFTTEEGSTLNNFGTISVFTADGGTTTGTLDLGGDTYNHDTIIARNGDTFDAGVIRNSGTFTNASTGYVNTDTELENTNTFINDNANFSPLDANLKNTKGDIYVDEAERTDLYIMVSDGEGLVTAWGALPVAGSNDVSPFYYEDSEGYGLEGWRSGFTYALYGTQNSVPTYDFPLNLPSVMEDNVTLDLNGCTLDLTASTIYVEIDSDTGTVGGLTVTDSSAEGTGELLTSNGDTLLSLFGGSLTVNGAKLSSTYKSEYPNNAVIYAATGEDTNANSIPSSITITGGSTVTNAIGVAIDATDTLITVDGSSTVTGQDVAGIRFTEYGWVSTAKVGIQIISGTVTSGVGPDDEDEYGDPITAYGIEYFLEPNIEMRYSIVIGELEYSASEDAWVTIPKYYPAVDDPETYDADYWVHDYDSLAEDEFTISDNGATLSGTGALRIRGWED